MKNKNETKKIISSLFIFLIIVSTILFSVPEKTFADNFNESTIVPFVSGVDAAGIANAMEAASASGLYPGPGFEALINQEVVDEQLAALGDVTTSREEKPPADGWLQKAVNWVVSNADVGILVDQDSSLAMKIAAAGREVLRQALIVFGHKLLDTMTQSTVNWINSGFHGSPLFVQNPEAFFGDIGKFEVKKIVDMVGYDSMQPFGQSYALGLIARYKAQSQADMQSSLSLVLNDPALATQYRNNFFAGGWNAFLINTQYPQNNYLGYTMKMDETVLSKLAGNTSVTNTIQKAQTLLSQGSGFLSPTTCPKGIKNADAYNAKTINEFNPPTYPSGQYAKNHPYNPPNPTLDPAGYASYVGDYAAGEASDAKSWSEANQCLDANGKSALVATTPGAVAANHIMTALNLKTGVAGLDAALGNSFSAILNAFMNHFLSEGLTGLSNAITGTPSISDNWSYQGQTLSSTSTTATNPLTIPTNVSVNISASTSTTISGGTAPYSITTQPDNTIATAQIGTDGTTLTVTGITQGTTTMTIQDSSSTGTVATPTPQISTITLRGSAGTAGMLSATINSITTNVLVASNDTPTTAATSLASAINANAKLTGSVIATNTTPGAVTITSKTPGTAGVFSLTSANTTTALTATSALTASASDGLSPNQNAIVTITVGTNGTIAINFTNTTKNPKSISISNSTVSNLILSGGIAPYSVQTAPDSTLALTLISDNNLSIVGIAPGTTSVVLRDSATPATTVTLQIVIGTETPLSASPQNVSGAASGTVTTAISGGTAPYTVVTQPDQSIASALISGNTLTIIGTGAGSTSVTIQDSFSPAETLTIPITISASATQNTGTTSKGGI